MPIYEYKCNKCGKETSKIQKFDAEPPSCDHIDDEGVACDGKLEKRVSPNTFHLKGGGWFNSSNN